MKKNDLLEAWLETWDPDPTSPIPREYRAFFDCFNRGKFYEAHDVLEHLWLRCNNTDRSFYQALIQLAGAFVHFQKHATFPDHPTHKRRIAPGQRLLDLAAARLLPYGPKHLGVDIQAVLELCTISKNRAALGNNPLVGFTSPALHLHSRTQLSP
ncbi:MAG: DUF309 domain-containing protein [Verrucomicrobiota bacterium]